MRNYCVLSEYYKCVVPPLTWMVGPTINLISGTNYSCEMRNYAFMVFWEYLVIFCNKFLAKSTFLSLNTQFSNFITKVLNIVIKSLKNSIGSNLIFILWKILTDALRVMVNNLFKESFYIKRKKKVWTTFFISHKNSVKTFLK